MHDAWKPRAPEWAALAPGVRWRLRPLTGDIQALVNARVARTVGAITQSRAEFEDLGFDPEELGQLGDLNVLAGLSIYCAAVFTADQLLEAWEGLDDAETGEPVDCGTPEDRTEDQRAAIRAALRLGPPEGGPALLGPFMAWLERPRAPIAADLRRLRALAKWNHSGGDKHCEGCEIAKANCARGGTDGGDICPRVENAPRTEAGLAAVAATRSSGVWRRAGMGGQLTGLDYNACLTLGEAHGVADTGAFIRCLGAIEAGALEGAAERAKEMN